MPEYFPEKNWLNNPPPPPPAQISNYSQFRVDNFALNGAVSTSKQQYKQFRLITFKYAYLCVRTFLNNLCLITSENNFF